MDKKEASQFAKHSSIYAGGNILRQLAGFIMLPIYTQHLTPADYGIIGLLTFAISLIDLLFGARMVQAVPKFFHQFDNKTDRYAVISTAMIQTAAISTVTLLIVLLFRSDASSQLFGSTDYQLILGIFAVTILTQAIENYGLLFLRIQRKAWFFLALNFSKLITQLSLNIYFVVYLEMGVMGVAISTATVAILFAIILGAITLTKTGIKYRWELGNRMIIFCWPLWVAGVAALYIGSANRYYMRIYGNLDDIGLYELASRFAMILTVLVWRPINLYWQTERFKYYQADQTAPSIYATVFNYVTTLLIIAGLGISLFASPIIQLMATESYQDAASIVPILTLAGIFGSLITFSNFSFLATSNTSWIAKNNYLMTIPATICFFAFIPNYGFYGAAIAATLTTILQFTITHKASKKYYDMKLKMTPFYLKLGVAIMGYICMESFFNQEEIIWSIAARSAAFLITTLLIIGIIFSKKEHRTMLTNMIKSRLTRNN
jgi:O-antigen/teichoic acid export membrane protein